MYSNGYYKYIVLIYIYIYRWSFSRIYSISLLNISLLLLLLIIIKLLILRMAYYFYKQYILGNASMNTVKPAPHVYTPFYSILPNQTTILFTELWKRCVVLALIFIDTCSHNWCHGSNNGASLKVNSIKNCFFFQHSCSIWIYSLEI